MARRTVQSSRILLTGASSGIGWHLALQLAQNGARVLATARRESRLLGLLETFQSQKLQLQTRGEIQILAGDITCPKHREVLIAKSKELWSGLDVLVNNAGVGAMGEFARAQPSRLRSIMEVDFFAATELSRIALDVLEKGNRPAIVIISSVLAHRAVPRKSEYCAAKFALRGWSEAIRVELKPKGIDVIVVSPSTTASEFFDHLIETSKNERSYSIGVMQPEQVARSVIRAIQKGRRETILSLGGKTFVYAARFFPVLLDRLLKNV